MLQASLYILPIDSYLFEGGGGGGGIKLWVPLLLNVYQNDNKSVMGTVNMYQAWLRCT
jgi:hypothetical protein